MEKDIEKCIPKESQSMNFISRQNRHRRIIYTDQQNNRSRRYAAV